MARIGIFVKKLNGFFHCAEKSQRVFKTGFGLVVVELFVKILGGIGRMT